MYAEIAVNRPIDQTFYYHIPPELSGEGKLRLGHLVEVSFGTALMTGVVVGIHATKPDFETKPIRRRLDPTPVLTPLQLEMAWWLAHNTLTPIGLCINLMLPPGLATQSKTLYHLKDEHAEGNTFAQKRVLSLLRSRGDLSNNQIKRALPKMNWQSALQQLVQRNILESDIVFEPPKANPKTVRSVRLAIPSNMIRAIAPNLGRESRRASVIEVLRATPGRRMTLDDVMQTTGCKVGPVQALESLSYVRLSPEKQWVALNRQPEEIQEIIKNSPLTEAPKRVLKTLLPSETSLSREELSTSVATLKTLEELGYIRTWLDHAMVELTLPDPEISDILIQLREGESDLAILKYLAKFDGESIPVKEVYEKLNTTSAKLKRLADDGLVVFGEEEIIRDSLDGEDFKATLPPTLTEGQQQTWEPIRQYQTMTHWEGATPNPDTPHVFLLHGVTGSGKTEIYMRAVAQALAQGRQAIILVPEIALTTQLSQRFLARFPGKVAVVHSQLSHGERYDTWRRARMGEIQIVLGARSALFTPLPDIGLIVLDEEHDDSYKQSPPIAAPHYHARDMAIEIMRQNRGTVILGSATPDLTTMYQAEQGNFVLLNLPDRVMAHRDQIVQQTKQLNLPQARYFPADTGEVLMAELPPVQIIDMRQELRVGNRSIFSRLLQQKLRQTLDRKEQAILFLNRRGTSTFVMCRNCGYIARCPRCDTSLTYHTHSNKLTCHYCGHRAPNPKTCPDCESTRIRYFGSGTEQIDTLLNEEFPDARILRWDQDTASEKGAHKRILNAFMNQEADLLVGTQMIAKGLDIPLVTLVGVISADTALGLPDFRSAERTFQLLTQVAGRAGRGLLKGEVIFQTYQPEHYAIQTASRHDYFDFYRQEVEFRRENQYPPFKQLARLLFQEKTLDDAQREATQTADMLRNRIQAGNFTSTEIVGPTPCFFMRRDTIFRWQVLVRSADVVGFLRGAEISNSATIDIHPVDLL